MRIVIPRANWTAAWAGASRIALANATIVVQTEAMQELALRAMQRMERDDLTIEVERKAA